MIMDLYTSLGAWHLRLTCTLDFDTILGFVEEKICKKYIICHEVTHYHCYLVTGLSREQIRKDVNETLGLKGNGEFSIALVRKPTQMKKYILKDGYYKYKGFSKNEITILSRLSLKKKSKKYSEDLQQIEDDWISGKLKLSCGEVMGKIYYMKVTHGEHPMWSSIYRQVCAWCARRYGEDWCTSTGEDVFAAFKARETPFR